MYPFGTPPAGTGTVTGTCTGTGTGTGTGAEEEEDGERAMSLQAHYMTNTSQVDVFSSLEPHRLPDLRARFPSFVHHVVPAALQTILEPGDMLVLPPGYVVDIPNSSSPPSPSLTSSCFRSRWWHSMKSLEPSINLSMWF
jgi:lysine-specific demethylase 8